MQSRLILALTTAMSLTAVLRADNWPAWRGPDAMGHSTEQNLPLEWNSTENVRWRVALPDEGNSTPIVWGNRIFLTQAIGRDANARRQLWCLDRANGKQLWMREVIHKDKETTHADNPFCSASPATDGERVVVSYGSAGLWCYDFQGKELWHHELGKLEQLWGNASSPVLFGDQAYIWSSGERQFLRAVNKRTGEKSWQHDEPGGKFGKDQSEWIGSWSTPLVLKVADRDQLVMHVPDRVRAFDPKTGKELWSFGCPGSMVYTTPLYADGILVAMPTWPQPRAAMAVKLGGRGDITKDRVWHHAKEWPRRIGSGVVVGQHIYILNDGGLAQCFALQTGKEIWQLEKRFGGGSWGSMVAADGRLYVTNQAGATYVMRADPIFELLAVNRLNERTNASVAVSDGALFIRTQKHLYCIGAKK